MKMIDGVILRVISVSCHFSFLTEQLRRLKVNISVSFLAATPSCITQTHSNNFELAGRISASLGLASKFQFTSISKKKAGDLQSFIDSKQIPKYLGKVKPTYTRKQIRDFLGRHCFFDSCTNDLGDCFPSGCCIHF